MVFSSFARRIFAIGSAIALAFFLVLGTYAAHADEATTTEEAATTTATSADIVTPPDAILPADTATSTASSTDSSVPADEATTSATSTEPSAPVSASSTDTTSSTSTGDAATTSDANAGSSLLSGIASFPQAFWDFLKQNFPHFASTTASSTDASADTASSTPSPSFLARLFSLWQTHNQLVASSTATTTNDAPVKPHTALHKNRPAHLVGTVSSVSGGQIIVSAGGRAAHSHTLVTVLLTSATAITGAGGKSLLPGEAIEVSGTVLQGAYTASSIRVRSAP